MSEKIITGLMGFVERNYCPLCGGTFQHRSKCELKGLSITEAATLSIEEAKELARDRREK
jgi:hypothetical protein